MLYLALISFLVIVALIGVYVLILHLKEEREQSKDISEFSTFVIEFHENLHQIVEHPRIAPVYAEACEMIDADESVNADNYCPPNIILYGQLKNLYPDRLRDLVNNSRNAGDVIRIALDWLDDPANPIPIAEEVAMETVQFIHHMEQATYLTMEQLEQDGFFDPDEECRDSRKCSGGG